MSDTTPPTQDFAATVEQLETIVERLESGELSLEDALTAFEQGVRLTRNAQQRLDTAELKVRALSEDSEGRLNVAPFAGPDDPKDVTEEDSKETPPMVTSPPIQLATLRHTCNTRVDATLAALFDTRPAVAPRLEAAMRHGLLAGGKRLRPLLVYMAGHALGAEDNVLDAPAAAIELIHAYSLIHDDLPAMDDDDLRRGQPTVHKAFDEASAILAGDALQALAFEVLASTPHPRLGNLVHTLALASGRDGMVAGQALDLDAVGGHPDVETLAHMHAHKTGALIVAAVRMGGLVAVSEDDSRLSALTRYARAIGLAFQIHDDILDVTGDTITLGKTSGADAARAKPTYPSLLGLDGAQRKAHNLIDEAIAALTPLGERAAPLADLAHYMIERDH